MQPDGTLTTEDGQPICELDDSCEDASVETGETSSDASDAVDPGPGDGIEPIVCTCEVSAADSDGDCIEDALEPPGHGGQWDSDGDGIGDGCEDKNQNGIRDEVGGIYIETDPALRILTAMAWVMGSKIEIRTVATKLRKPIPFDLIPMETAWVMVRKTPT